MSGFGGGYSVAPAGGGAASPVLFSFNGADTAQLDAASAVVAGSVTGVTASVVTRSTGPALQIVGTRVGTGNGLLAVPLFDLGLPRAYRVRFRIREASGITAPDWAGLEFLSNGQAGAGRFGVCAMIDRNAGLGSAGVAPIIEAGAFSAGSWNTVNSFGWDDATTLGLGAAVEYTVQANLAGAKPEGVLVHRSLSNNAEFATQDEYATADFPSASWVPADLTTIGFCARDLSAASGAPIAFEISDLVVTTI